MLHNIETALFRVKLDIAGVLDKNHSWFVKLVLSAAFYTIDDVHWRIRCVIFDLPGGYGVHLLTFLADTVCTC